jgi:hypothetical protein
MLLSTISRKIPRLNYGGKYGIIKITKPGGIIISSLSKIAYDDHGFGNKMAQLDDTSAWEFLDRSRLFRTYPLSEKEKYIRH